MCTKLNYTMLQWSTDSKGRPLVIIRGQIYTHEETLKLKDELNCLMQDGPNSNTVRPKNVPISEFYKYDGDGN